MWFPSGSEAPKRLAWPVRHVAAACLLGLISPLFAAAAGGEVIRLGEAIEGELRGGGSRELLLDLPAGGVHRLRVEQLGVDVEIEVSGPGFDGAIRFDGPFDRRNVESLVVEPPAGSGPLRYRIVLRGREPGAPAGRFVLRATGVPRGSASLPLLRAETEAARHYVKGGADDRRAALELYRFAAEGWREDGAAREAARALYAAAVLHRLLDENEAALAAAERAAEDFRRLGEPVFEAYAWNEAGLDRWLLGRSAEARDAFRRALDLADRRDPYAAGAAAGNLCLMDFVAGDLRAGLACYEADRTGALARLRAAGAPALFGAAATSVGRAYDVLGEPDAARRRYAEALGHLRAADDAEGEARVLNNLGALHREVGSFDEALEAYDRALDAFRRLEDRRWQARVLNNLGFTYLELGERGRARQLLRDALPLWRAVDDPRGEASTLTNLARAASEAGEPAAARDLLMRALDRARAAEDGRAEATALSQLGVARLALGDEEAAREAFGRAAALFRELEDPASEALALRRLARLDLASARPGAVREGREGLVRAVELARASGHRAGEAEALTALARAERALGRPEAALARVAEAAESLDALRVRIASPDLRTSHAALQHGTYELWIDLLMAAHEREPERGFDRRALAVAERVRSRTLAELLHEAEVEAARGVPDELLDRRRDLERRLRAKVERAIRGGAAGAGRSTLESEAAEILRELEALEARIRRASPALAALVRPEPLDAAGVQALVDEGTLLLVYALGEERSFVWAVTAERIESHALRARRAIDSAIRRHHGRLARFDPAERHAEATAGAELARTLLGPVAGRLAEASRLVVVADGALHYLPFAALPVPGAGSAARAAPAVVERHEVVFLPSASALVALRHAGRPTVGSAAGRLAIVADPVFEPDDPRVVRVVRSQPSGAGDGAAPGAVRFARLPASRAEARAVAALAPEGDRKVLLDFEASREAVAGGGLAGYRVVHFATHGLIDEREPALSGLALSRVDPAGRARDGFLGLREIYDLRLDAELVVLSACRTALGSSVRGEGMVGLTRGFLHAGARRVLASLWTVEDAAAAELVTRFYRALWKDGLDAPAALRRAQRELRAERRYRDPAHWAGFVLVGDWR